MNSCMDDIKKQLSYEYAHIDLHILEEFNGQEYLYLFHALKTNTIVRDLRIDFFLKQKNRELLFFLFTALMMNKTITTLNLRYSHIGADVMHYLSKYLKVTNILTNLDLSFNNLGDDLVSELIEAL